jgi:hypothetical protein
VNLTEKAYRCEACGSTDPRPVTHKTWCSVRILDPSLHRFGVSKDMTGRVSA